MIRSSHVLLVLASVAVLAACSGPSTRGEALPAAHPYAYASTRTLPPARVEPMTARDVGPLDGTVHTVVRSCDLHRGRGAS